VARGAFEGGRAEGVYMPEGAGGNSGRGALARPDQSAARGYVTRGVARMQRLGFIGIPEVRTAEQLIRSHLQSEAA